VVGGIVITYEGIVIMAEVIVGMAENIFIKDTGIL
jgi:hypothetical protein